MPSLVAEIGCAIESHMKFIGLLKDEELSNHQQQILNEKRAAFEAKNAANTDGKKDRKSEDKVETESESDSGYPEGSQLCKKCHTKAMILLDGCMTCLSCGNSKCG